MLHEMHIIQIDTRTLDKDLKSLFTAKSQYCNIRTKERCELNNSKPKLHCRHDSCQFFSSKQQRHLTTVIIFINHNTASYDSKLTE